MLQANGLTLCSDLAGAGPDLLFLGGTGWDLRATPTPLQSPLTRHFHVALFDQRGQGRSDKPRGPYTMREYAEDAAAVMDALGWSSAHVVGYSFGGMVAQELAIRWPERINRLVLAATSSGGAGGSSFPIETFLPLDPAERAQRGLEVADLRLTPAFQERHPERMQQMIAKRVAAQTRFIAEPGAREGLAAQLAARADHDTYSRLDRITAPALVLSGRHDGQAPHEVQMPMVAKLPDACHEVLQGGHNFIHEDTGFYERVTAFLKDERLETRQ